jgi:hypothetical protein
MAQYYYLVSSLPYLRMNEEEAVKTEEFMALCRPWLGSYDMQLLMGAGINRPFSGQYGHEVLEKWKNFETGLRNSLVSYRAKNLNVEPKRYFRPVDDIDAGIESKVAETASEASPYSAEKKLIELRWRYLDNLESDYHFDIGYLLVYFLKVQLLERLGRFNKQAGEKVFNEIYL